MDVNVINQIRLNDNVLYNHLFGTMFGTIVQDAYI